jgi:hypothetical protein
MWVTASLTPLQNVYLADTGLRVQILPAGNVRKISPESAANPAIRRGV